MDGVPGSSLGDAHMERLATGARQNADIAKDAMSAPPDDDLTGRAMLEGDGVTESSELDYQVKTDGIWDHR